MVLTIALVTPLGLVLCLFSNNLRQQERDLLFYSDGTMDTKSMNRAARYRNLLDSWLNPFILGSFGILMEHYELKSADDAAVYTGMRTPKFDAPLQTVVCNHSSVWDIFICSAFSASFVAKSFIKDIPVLNWFARLNGVLLLDSNDSHSRKSTASAIIRRQQRMQALRNANVKDPLYNPLLIYPEGMTSSGTCILPFSIGAFTAKCPIRPMLIIYESEGADVVHWDLGSVIYPLVLSASDWHIKRAKVYWLPEYRALEGETAQMFADRIRNDMIKVSSRVNNRDTPVQFNKAVRLSSEKKRAESLLRSHWRRALTCGIMKVDPKILSESTPLLSSHLEDIEMASPSTVRTAMQMDKEHSSTNEPVFEAVSDPMYNLQAQEQSSVAMPIVTSDSSRQSTNSSHSSNSSCSVSSTSRIKEIEEQEYALV